MDMKLNQDPRSTPSNGLSITIWSGIALIALSLVGLQANRDAVQAQPALLLERSLEGIDRDLATLGSACHDGHAESCRTVGLRLDHTSGDEALPWFKEGCQLGDTRSCEQVVAISREPASVRSALDRLRSACEVKHESESCRTLAKSFEELGASDQAIEFTEKACLNGSAVSCLEQARLNIDILEKSEQALEDLRRFCALTQSGELSPKPEQAKRLCEDMKFTRNRTSRTMAEIVRQILKANVVSEQARMEYRDSTKDPTRKASKRL